MPPDTFVYPAWTEGNRMAITVPLQSCGVMMVGKLGTVVDAGRVITAKKEALSQLRVNLEVMLRPRERKDVMIVWQVKEQIHLHINLF